MNTGITTPTNQKPIQHILYGSGVGVELVKAADGRTVNVDG